MEETPAQEALRLLSSVPAEKYITHSFSDENNQCCAIGHYIRLKSGDPNNYSTENCSDYFFNFSIREMSTNFIKHQYGIQGASIATVNNGNAVNGYSEPAIKDRVIHLLQDMVKAGY